MCRTIFSYSCFKTHTLTFLSHLALGDGTTYGEDLADHACDLCGVSLVVVLTAGAVVVHLNGVRVVVAADKLLYAEALAQPGGLDDQGVMSIRKLSN